MDQLPIQYQVCLEGLGIFSQDDLIAFSQSLPTSLSDFEIESLLCCASVYARTELLNPEKNSKLFSGNTGLIDLFISRLSNPVPSDSAIEDQVASLESRIAMFDTLSQEENVDRDFLKMVENGVRLNRDRLRESLSSKNKPDASFRKGKLITDLLS